MTPGGWISIHPGGFSVYSYQGLLYHVPLLQHHQEQGDDLFSPGKFSLDFRGIPGKPLAPAMGPWLWDAKNPVLDVLAKHLEDRSLAAAWVLGQRPWRYPNNKVLVFVNASIF